jgi:hypothetical protein
MSLSWFHRLLKKSRPLPRPFRTNVDHGRFLPKVEALDERVLPAVTASFTAAGGLLRVVGDALDNTVVVSRDAAGTILVNNGAVDIQGGPATVANTRQIMINGGAGNDTLSLDETNGALPAAALFGGAGNDVLVGGSGDDIIDGGAGSDTAFLGAGDDTFSWNPGDGSDVVEGQGGRDTLAFNGSNDAERFDLSANGTHARFTRDVGGIAMDLNGVEEIDLNAPGGGDIVTINDQSATGLNTFNVDLGGPAGRVNNQPDVVIINGTNGNDVGQIRSIGPTSINATVSAIPFVNITNTVPTNDRLLVNTLGGYDVLDASDLAAGLIKLTVNGGTGNDTLIGSQGFDDFLWTPGDGSDTIEGGGGQDRIVVDGSDAADQFTISANGTRARVTSDVDGGTVDVGGVETIVVNPLGGADTITVNDLTGTAVTGIGVNLVATLTGPAGDGQADSVIVNGRNAADLIPIRGDNGLVFIDGGADVGAGGGRSFGLTITAAEGAIDTLTVNGLGGNDTVDASGLAAGVIGLIVNGGAGNDTLTGSQGNDAFVWNPGDGSDTIDGQAGTDLLRFVGADGNESIALSANGPRVRLTRDVGGVAMDLNGLELINVLALGGSDTITVNDLTGTGVRVLNLGLGATATTGDGQADTVIVNGTNGNDHINVGGLAGGTTVVNVVGLSALVSITNSDGPGDSLVINALGGNDTVDASGLPAGLIGLTVNLGDGQGAATTTALRTPAPTAVVGQAVTFTATVTAVAPGAGTPTGMVIFLDGSTVLGTAAVGADGTATLTTRFAAAGGHAVTAVYGGDGAFAGSAQAVTEQVRAPPALAPTTTALAASARVTRRGQAVTFTTTVRGGPGAGTPTGTVSFLVGNRVVARVILDAAGQARFTRRFAAGGRFVLRAVYSGDGSFAGSAQSITERVRP